MKKNKPQKKFKPTKSITKESGIDLLMAKRTGGSINFKGIDFQSLYAVYVILSKLDPNSNKRIQLEGLEDIDIADDERKEYIQVKTSINQIDAGKLWGLNVLQNFMEVYSKQPASLFRLVHNTSFSKGSLDILTDSDISEATRIFWKDKFDEAGYTLSAEVIKSFFRQITIEATSEKILYAEIGRLLYHRYSINNETEESFIKALFYNVIQWSKRRQSISANDLELLMQSVKDRHAKFPSNPAIQHNWITKVSYSTENSLTADDYYEGKAARPIHIALGLPVGRPHWESEIIKALRGTHITIIKSSSGQGKSTLAWQVGHLLCLEGNSVYQLNYCPTWEQVIALADFVETRLKIGETPLIIIDGLNQSVSGWEELAIQLLDKPVKLLITAREEDWYRYGADVSKASMKTVNIKLTIAEAESIFKELKKNNKIHNEIDSWQPAWEKIEQKGLLIEYVYLLTSGEMISERLEHQVKQLHREQSASAKIEILRLISLADVLNIKIRTNKLTTYINNSVRFDADRNEVYRQLEKEYYLRFGMEYIEGLHPVRSMHLVDILHSHIAVDESLLALLQLIENEVIYDYFIAAPFFINPASKGNFYRGAAVILSHGDFPEMVYAIDGLMHYEPIQYWMENKAIYDEVFATGGIQLFVDDSIPFNSLHTIEKLTASMSDMLGSNMPFLATKLKELSNYNFGLSDVSIFARELHASLTERQNIKKVEGIVFLSKWFRKVGLEFPDILELHEQKLLEALSTAEIGESADLFRFFSITDPVRYKSFVGSHRNTIIGWIKRKTNTLAITEKSNDIHITYLLDENADKANEYSVYRINIVQAFFPDYAHYCTEPIVLPFPNEEVYKVVVQNGTKAISKKGLFDNFDIHINQIWSKTILRNYTALSAYEWQEQHFNFRKNAIEVTRLCVRIFECHLMNNVPRLKTVVEEWKKAANKLLLSHQVLKKYPSKSPKYFEREKFVEEEKKIHGFFISIRNFLNQMSGIIEPKREHDRNLPIINLKTAVYNLPGMQLAFGHIIDNSFAYFPFSSLETQEREWYSRLSHTAQFYIHYVKTGSTERIVKPMRSIERWRETTQQINLSELHAIIKDYEGGSTFIFFLPTEIIEDEYLKSVVIGVQGCDLMDSQQDHIFELVMGLHKLAKTDIQFFTFVFVNAEKEVTGAVRFNDHNFRRFNTFFENGEVDNEENFSAPIPIFPDKSMLEKIEGGIHIKTVPARNHDEDFYKMMIEIWTLSQYRNSLGSSLSLPEREWLEENESIYANSILKYADAAEAPSKPSCYPVINDIISFVKREIDFSTEEIVSIMLNRLLANQPVKPI